MIHSKLSRRDFLKTMASIFVGVLATRFEKLIRLGNLPSKNPFKEAKYYKAGNNLAG